MKNKDPLKLSSNSKQKSEENSFHRIWLRSGWGLTLVGVSIFIMALWNPARIDPSVVWSIAGPIIMIATIGVAVFIHELGHLTAAHLLRLNPWSVILGQGRTIWEGMWWGSLWTVKALPVSGMVRVLPSSITESRFRMLLMVAAGPGASFIAAFFTGLVLFGGLGLWPVPVWWRLVEKGDTPFPVLVVFLMANAIFGIASLVPHNCKYDDMVFPSDGLLILRGVRGHAFGVQTSGTESSGGSSGSHEWSNQWAHTVRSGGGNQMLRQCRALLGIASLDSNQRCQVLDQFATAVLMTGDSSLLEEADRYSEELFQAQPTEWTVMGTRGSVLIELGRLEEGEKLLNEVVEKDPSKFDCAISSAYLGLAAIKRGQPEAAAVWLSKAREFDPDCVPLQRFEQMLKEL